MPSPICPAPRTPTLRISIVCSPRIGVWTYDNSAPGVNVRGRLASPAERMVDRASMSEETSIIVPAIRGALDEALAAGRKTTADGKAIDDHQVHAERLAYAATETAAAEALVAYAGARRDAGAAEPAVERMAAAFAGET